MARIIYSTLLLVFLFMVSCKLGSEKKPAESNAAATVATDSTLQAKDSVINDLSDPDPNDSIPSTTYGIYSYRKEAVTLAKSALQDL